MTKCLPSPQQAALASRSSELVRVSGLGRARQALCRLSPEPVQVRHVVAPADFRGQIGYAIHRYRQANEQPAPLAANLLIQL